MSNCGPGSVHRAVPAAVCVLGLALASCGSTGATDLGTNEWLYGGSGYRARIPGDRPAFVAPVRDARTAPDPAPDGEFTISYYSDDRWERPPAQMIDDVVRSDLAESGVFTEVSERPWSNGCTINVELRQFDVGSEMHVTGWRSFAALTIAVEVNGPLTPAGNRPVLLQEQFDESLHSFVSWDPPAASQLMATILERVMNRMLGVLDQEGVGRAEPQR